MTERPCLASHSAAEPPTMPPPMMATSAWCRENCIERLLPLQWAPTVKRNGEDRRQPRLGQCTVHSAQCAGRRGRCRHLYSPWRQVDDRMIVLSVDCRGPMPDEKCAG